jgi:Ca2+-binding RTX toxin-like protein
VALTGIAAAVQTLLAPPLDSTADWQGTRNANPVYVGFSNGSLIYFTWNASQVILTPDNSTLIGTGGNDSFDYRYYSNLPQGSITKFMGGDGNDIVGGSNNNDQIWGGSGADKLYGYAGDDSLYGNEGDDTLLGGDGTDTLVGGAGADILFGGAGNDRLSGGDGDDTLVGFNPTNADVWSQTLAPGQTDDDKIWGGAGKDFVLAGAGNDQVWGGNEAGGKDKDGVSIGDVILGGAGDDQVWGEGGDDRIFGGAGNDQLWGGTGDDVLVANNPTGGINQATGKEWCKSPAPQRPTASTAVKDQTHS